MSSRESAAFEAVLMLMPRLSSCGDERKGFVELGCAEIGPRTVGEEHARIGCLPKQEVGHSRFTRGSYEQVHRGERWVVQFGIDRGHRRGGGAARGSGNFRPAPIIERHGQDHSGVVFGVVDGLGNRLLYRLWCPRAGFIERATNPIDTNVVGIEFIDSPEEFPVKSQDVTNLGGWTNPILGTESKDGEPANVSFGSSTNHVGEGFFSGGVAGRAGQASALGPTSVAIHDAGHMKTAGRRDCGSSHGVPYETSS